MTNDQVWKRNVKQILEYLLYKQYHGEFEITDGLNQHPSGYSYDDWLRKSVGISPQEYFANHIDE